MNPLNIIIQGSQQIINSINEFRLDKKQISKENKLFIKEWENKIKDIHN